MPLQSIAETVEGAENGSEGFEEGGGGNRNGSDGSNRRRDHGKACRKGRKQKPGQARRLPINDVCFDKPQRLRAGHLLTIFQISAPQLYKMRANGKSPPAGILGKELGQLPIG